MNNTQHLDESVQNYLTWLKNIKKAPYHTYRAYQVDLLQFLKYFLRIEINEMPGKILIEDYLTEVKNKFNYASYRRKITVLRNFTKYLIDSGINVPDPFISITLPIPEVNFNLPVKYEDILNLIAKLPEVAFNETRDKIIFSLIAKSGLTIKQLLSLRVKDINLASNQIVLSRNHLTFVDGKTIALIEKYFSKIKENHALSLDDYLIANHLKNPQVPLSPRTINLVIDKTAKDMDFKFRLSPTILRRLFARSLSDKNINKATQELILGKKCTLVS